MIFILINTTKENNMQHYEAVLPLQLKNLKLSAINANWQNIATLAEKDNWLHGKYLSNLCDIEIQQREQTRLTRRLKESLLPKNKTLSS